MKMRKIVDTIDCASLPKMCWFLLITRGYQTNTADILPEVWISEIKYHKWRAVYGLKAVYWVRQYGTEVFCLYSVSTSLTFLSNK